MHAEGVGRAEGIGLSRQCLWGVGRATGSQGLAAAKKPLGDIRDTFTVLWVVLWKFTVLWK